MSDEGVHEIQLNGKQLVFLFMAATVAAVAIFLCGVMVGRGVPTRASASDALGDEARLDPAPYTQESSSSQAGTGNEPGTPQETLTYPTLLDDPNPPAEALTPPSEPTVALPAPSAPAAPTSRATTAAPPPAAPTPRATTTAPLPTAPAPRSTPAAAAVTARTTPATTLPAPAAARTTPVPAVAVPAPALTTPALAPAPVTLAEPPGTGFVVQVAAVRQRGEADSIAHRLSAKGYPAFVTTSGANFRVRVGKYSDRREAESIAGRLEKEERFTPWITR